MIEVIDGVDHCKVATYWANGNPVKITEGACAVCVGTATPRGLNRVTVSLGLGKLKEVDEKAFEYKLHQSLEHIADPGASEALARYAEATMKWMLLGRPVRTDEQVLEVLKICQGCDKYKDGKCSICGCLINAGGGWTSKARRLNEHCPLGNW